MYHVGSPQFPLHVSPSCEPSRNGVLLVSRVPRIVTSILVEICVTILGLLAGSKIYQAKRPKGPPCVYFSTTVNFKVSQFGMCLIRQWWFSKRLKYHCPICEVMDRSGFSSPYVAWSNWFHLVVPFCSQHVQCLGSYLMLLVHPLKNFRVFIPCCSIPYEGCHAWSKK